MGYRKRFACRQTLDKWDMTVFFIGAQNENLGPHCVCEKIWQGRVQEGWRGLASWVPRGLH